MYFSYFVATLFIGYFTFLYFFYMSIIRFSHLKNQHAIMEHDNDDHLRPLVLKLFMHLVILLPVFFIVILFIASLSHIYKSTIYIYVKMSVLFWAYDYFYLSLFGIFWIFSVVTMVLYHACCSRYMSDLGMVYWHHNDVFPLLFDFPRIKKFYKIIGIVLVSYFILSFVQYYIYLDRIDEYVAINKYRPFPPPSDEYLEQEITKRLNVRYMGWYYADVFDTVVQDVTQTSVSKSWKGEGIQISMRSMRFLGTFNFLGAFGSCDVHFYFSENGMFSHMESNCYKIILNSLTP